MKFTICFILLLSCSLVLFSQKDSFTFGNVSIADLEMKQCTFDKDAEAMVLFDLGRTFCYTSTNFTTTFDKQKRIKIFNQKGLDEADIKIRFSADKRKGVIKNLVAQTYTLDANRKVIITKVEKENIYEKKINNRTSEYSFSFPNVKPGCIIEFKYSYEATSISIRDWYFQENIPVKYSSYTLDFPTELEIGAISQGSLLVNKVEKNQGLRTINAYSVSNAFSLKEEPYMSSFDNYLTKIIPIIRAYNPDRGQRVDLTSTWPLVIDELMYDEDFGLQLKKELPRTTDLDEAIKNIKVDFQKMKIIHNYVRNNMTWDNKYSLWALDGVKQAWKEKKGNSGEINLILINLLKDAKLDARALLVSTKGNGLVNTMNVDIDQFDKVMAYVKINDNIYILDATEKNTPSHLIPMDVTFSEAIVINKLQKGGWGWVRLWDPKIKAHNSIVVSASIAPDGALKGTTKIYSKDYAKLERMEAIQKSKIDFEKNYFLPKHSSLTIEKVEYKNEKSDSLALEQNITFTHKLNTTGEYTYFSLNLFSGLDKNPFTNENRISDVYYGQNQKIEIIGYIDVAENYIIEELPKNVKYIIPDSSILLHRQIKNENNILSYKITIEYLKPYYSPNEYTEFYEFHKIIYRILEEQIVLKKIK